MIWWTSKCLTEFGIEEFFRYIFDISDLSGLRKLTFIDQVISTSRIENLELSTAPRRGVEKKAHRERYTTVSMLQFITQNNETGLLAGKLVLEFFNVEVLNNCYKIIKNREQTSRTSSTFIIWSSRSIFTKHNNN